VSANVELCDLSGNVLLDKSIKANYPFRNSMNIGSLVNLLRPRIFCNIFGDFEENANFEIYLNNLKIPISYDELDLIICMIIK